jgi:TRAP-type C4-dicarboxylate transport system substrate-binding protein
MLRIIITLTIALLLPFPAAAVTLKIATLAPDGTRWMQAMRDGAAEVKRLTGGRVKLRFYPGGVMGNDQSVLRKIRVGQLHGGALTGGGLAAIDPDTQIYSLPFMFESFAEVAYVRKRVDPTLIAGLKRKGFVSFGFADGGFAYLMSQQPITRIEQLRAQKMWVPEGDEPSRRVMKALGVSAIPLPLTDVLTGLQTGLIDTVAASPVGAIALQWHSRIHYLTNVPLLYIYGTLVIKDKAFKRLSKADQQSFRQAMEQAFVRIGEQNQEDNRQARAALVKQGIQFVRPDDADMAAWRRAVDQAVNEMAGQGVFSSKLLHRVRADLDAYRKR